MALDPSPAAAEAPELTAQDNIKETFEAIVVAFILAFVFRAFVVEAFIIPTGSMAPTLLGEHVRIVCQQCGYRFDADHVAGKTPTHALCPMCQYPNAVKPGTRVSAGDRILVHKYIYSITEPRRWDVVVFKAPHEPETNYIKRLVGLPFEQLRIIEGRVYVRNDDPNAPARLRAWHIARKTERDDGTPLEKVQRAVWQPVYHSQYIPLETIAGNKDTTWHWRVPWSAEPEGDGAWGLDGRRSYRFGRADAGSIKFDFERQVVTRDVRWRNYSILFPYDQWHFDQGDRDPMEDVRVGAGFEPDAPGLSVRLETQGRWALPRPGGISDGDVQEPVNAGKPVAIAGIVTADGQARIELPTVTGENLSKARVLAQTSGLGPFPPGRTRNVELWYVDQEASLWIDGRRVLVARFDLSIDQVTARKPLPNGYLPKIRIEVSGSPVSLHQVEVDRNICYRTNMEGRRALGGVDKRGGEARIAEELQLEQDEFFCMGDNSPLSLDGRFWDSVNHWVRDYYLQDNTRQIGVVPRRLMMGRAFFVYWPGMYGVAPDSWAFVPNFGDMRFIH